MTQAAKMFEAADGFADEEFVMFDGECWNVGNLREHADELEEFEV